MNDIINFFVFIKPNEFEYSDWTKETKTRGFTQCVGYKIKGVIIGTDNADIISGFLCNESISNMNMDFKFFKSHDTNTWSDKGTACYYSDEIEQIVKEFQAHGTGIYIFSTEYTDNGAHNEDSDYHFDIKQVRFVEFAYDIMIDRIFDMLNSRHGSVIQEGYCPIYGEEVKE